MKSQEFLIQQVRILILAQGILSIVANAPLVPGYIRLKFKRALPPLVKVIGLFTDLWRVPLNWKDKVEEVMV